MGEFKSKTPKGGTLDLPDGCSLETALSSLDIPRQRIQVVSINGSIDRNYNRTLETNDELVVLAPVAGG